MGLLVECVKLRADLGRGQAQLGELLRAQLGVVKALAQAPGGACHFVEIAQHLQLSGKGRRVILVGASAQEQPWILQQTLTHHRRALREGRAQLAHLIAAQLGHGDRLGQPQAVLTVAAGDRHQVAHRRMGGDGAAAHMILDLRGKLTDQGQTPRDPAHAFVHPQGQLLLAQPLATQRRQQPALLQLREAFRAALAAVQQQGIALIELQERRPHRVRAQELEAAQALEAVDDHVRVFPLHHHDRILLTMLGDRGQQSTLTLGAPQT